MEKKKPCEIRCLPDTYFACLFSRLEHLNHRADHHQSLPDVHIHVADDPTELPELEAFIFPWGIYPYLGDEPDST